ncbi:MAG: hypothetical protein ACLP50_15735 [Solirubrobacteraceae bacterium]
MKPVNAARLVLAGLLVSMAALALPGAAAASVTPSLAVTQSGTTAGSSVATGFTLTFNPSAGDSVSSFSLALPEGALLNLGLDGNACLTATAPSSACAIASGTATVAGSSTPATLFLVAPPVAADVAGVALTYGSTTVVGDLTFQSSPAGSLALSFSGLNLKAPALTALSVTFSALRLPTSCPATPATVSLSATSADVSSSAVSAAPQPLTVTGCSALPYSPQISASVTRVTPSTSTADLALTATQTAAESATQTIALGIPAGLTVNRVLGPCLEGSPCEVGTATLTSPLLPLAALGSGTITLGGSFEAATLTIAFPAPAAFSVVGTIDFTNRKITFAGMPDIPFSSLALDITGPSAGPAFITTCARGVVSANFTPQDGAPALPVTGPVAYVGSCPPPVTAGPPTASVKVIGLTGGHPQAALKVTHGKGAPDLSSVSIGVPGGLSFVRGALVSHQICKAKHRDCRTTVTLEGSSVSGATVKSVKIAGGRLVITFAKPASAVTLRAGGALLSETASLVGRVKSHKVKTVALSVRVTDAKGTATTLALTVKV